MELTQNGTVSVEVPLGGENGDEAITYYVYETDSNGKKAGNGFAYEITVDGSKVLLDRDNNTAVVEITNEVICEETEIEETEIEETEIETEEETETAEAVPEKTSEGVDTGDHSNIYLFSILVAAAFIMEVILIRKRSKI